MLEIALNIAWQNIQHKAVIMNSSSAADMLASATLCQEDEFNLEELSSTASSLLSNSSSSTQLSICLSSTHLSDNSDISTISLNSSDSYGSNRKYNESSIIVASDTSDSGENSSPRHDLSLEIPVLYATNSPSHVSHLDHVLLSPDTSKRLTTDKDVTLTLTPTSKKIKLEDNDFNRTF